jgi:hypothetical protein
MIISLKAPLGIVGVRLVGIAVLTCLALPSGIAACKNVISPHSAMAVRLSEVPKTIRDLAKAIQGNTPAQMRETMIRQYGASRHVGSGLDIEAWDVAGGLLVFHPLTGPFFDSNSKQQIWLLATNNRALPNLLGAFEMTTTPDRDGMHYWLGDLSLRPDRTYVFGSSNDFPEQWAVRSDNFFKQHPSGTFEIQYEAGCTDETLLEGLPNNAVLCQLVLLPMGGGRTADYSVLVSTDERRLIVRSAAGMDFEMKKWWSEFWK